MRISQSKNLPSLSNKNDLPVLIPRSIEGSTNKHEGFIYMLKIVLTIFSVFSFSLVLFVLYKRLKIKSPVISISKTKKYLYPIFIKVKDNRLKIKFPERSDTDYLCLVVESDKSHSILTNFWESVPFNENKLVHSAKEKIYTRELAVKNILFANKHSLICAPFVTGDFKGIPKVIGSDIKFKDANEPTFINGFKDDECVIITGIIHRTEKLSCKVYGNENEKEIIYEKHGYNYGMFLPVFMSFCDKNNMNKKEFSCSFIETENEIKGTLKEVDFSTYSSFSNKETSLVLFPESVLQNWKDTSFRELEECYEKYAENEEMNFLDGFKLIESL